MDSGQSWIIGSSSQALGGLLISEMQYIMEERLKKDGVNSILSIMTHQQMKKMKIPEGKLNHKIINIQDDSSQNIKNYFNQCYYWIVDALTKGNVVVHCRSGVSRSPTIVAAYLIKQKKWKSEKALQYIKQKRQAIDPNQGFIEQLKLYQLSLNIQ